MYEGGKGVIMKKFVLILLAVILVGSLLFGCGEAAPTKVYELSFALFQPEAAPVSKSNTAYARAIEEATNGQVKVTVHQGGSLLGAPAMYQGIIDGIADMGNGISSYDPGAFPLTYAIEVPVSGESGWVLSAAAFDFMRKYEPKEWGEVMVLTTVMTGAGVSVTGTGKVPVRTLEDMKGKSMRTNSVEFTEALGATIKDMPMSAVYDAISKGVIDGCVTSLEPLGAGWKLGDVMKYVTLYLDPDQPTVMWYNAMNKDKWNSLPPDIQKTLLDVSAEQSRAIGLVWDDQFVNGLKYAISVGSEIYVLPPEEAARWTEVLKPVTEYQLDLAASKSGYTREFINEVYNYMLDRVAYWNGQQAKHNVTPSFDRIREVLKQEGLL